MSGITGAYYRVETAAERLQREQRAEWERYSQARAELEALRVEAEAFRATYGGKAIAKVAKGAKARPDAAPARIAAATASMAALVTTERAALRAAVDAAARAEVASLFLTVATTEVASPAPASVRVEPAAAPAPAVKEDGTAAARDRRRAQVADRASTLLARIPADADADVRARCAELVTEIGGVPSESRSRLLLRALEERVRTETVRVERVAESRQRLLALDSRLDEAPARWTGPLRARIAALVESGATELPDGLEEEVGKLIAAADRARQRKAVADELRIALGEEGYVVGEGFETRLANEGVAYAAMAGGAGYGVKFMLDAGRPVARTVVVRDDRTPGGATADTAAEKSYCDDYTRIARRLRRAGVQLADIELRPPGSLPVQAVAADVLPSAAPAAHQRNRPREMGR